MTKPFAKLFEHETYGQILVLLDTDDDGDPAVKFMSCPANLGICTTKFGFKQWDRAEAAFADVFKFSEDFA
jgi:hypothetical protein